MVFIGLTIVLKNVSLKIDFNYKTLCIGFKKLSELKNDLVRK